MSKNETSEQESGESVDEKRAEWERFSMTVLDGEGGGYVNVRNDSYSDGDHTYSVKVSERGATGCSCPHYQHRSPEGGCKHMIAVEQSPIVLSTASATSAPVATDGGEDTITDDEGDERPARSESPEMGGGPTSGVDEL